MPALEVLDMHALRVLALFVPLLASCTGPSLTTRHQELEDAWSRAAPAPSPGADPLAGHTTLERQAVEIGRAHV